MRKSPKLDTSVRTELADLKAEIEAVAPLLKKLAVQEPDSIELRAVAATLHAFYNGIERVFLLIARHVDEMTPQGITWHRDLLSQMTDSSTRRAPVVSDALAEEFQQRESDIIWKLPLEGATVYLVFIRIIIPMPLDGQAASSGRAPAPLRSCLTAKSPARPRARRARSRRNSESAACAANFRAPAPQLHGIDQLRL